MKTVRTIVETHCIKNIAEGKIRGGLLVCVSLLAILFFSAAKAQVKETKFTSVLTPVFSVASKSCKTDDAYISEGDEFGKVCPGRGKYKLLLSGFDYRVNYGVVLPKTDFAVYFHPLETGAAKEFERGDLYVEKFANQIEWRLADGIPFAAIARVEFYKNMGGARTFKNPKNKVGEFVFVRGLKGFENLREDLDALQTAFNPQEQAHLRADEFYEQRKK
jgi:hypothetical protein